MRLSLVTSGTRCTRLVAAMISSAGSPRKSSVRIARQTSSERPHVDAGERPNEIRVVEIDLDPTQLSELPDLPEHDRGDAPRLLREELALAPRQLTGEGAEQDVGVEIQHPSGRPSRGCSP